MGRVFQPVYWKKLPDGTRTQVATKAWHAEWQVAGKTKRKKIGSRLLANAALAKFEDAECRRRLGLPDPRVESARLARPLAEWLSEYLELLIAQGTSKEYQATSRAQLTRILAECKWHVWSDVKPDGLIRFLGRIRDTPRPKTLTGAAKKNAGSAVLQHEFERGCGPATLNGYLRAVKTFTRWLADQFTSSSLLSKIKPFPEAVDARRSQRVLTDDELSKLITAAAAAKRKGTATVRGRDRAMLYTIAAFSGLRAGELSDLTPGHFSLDAEPPVVTVEAADAKGKRTEPIPLPDHVVEVLRPWMAGRKPNQKLFPGNWAACRKQSHWLAADLRRAGVDARDGKGRPATFHSLKRRFVVRLIQAGAKIHEVRRMARHTDVSTTLKYYVDENLHELAALVNRLPPI